MVCKLITNRLRLEMRRWLLTTGGEVLEQPFNKNYWEKEQNSFRMELEEGVKG